MVKLYSEFVSSINSALTGSSSATVNGEYDGERNADGLREGRGVYRYASGNVYEGEWKADHKEGRGTLRFANSNVYEGEWKGGNAEGHGKMRYASGNLYEGDWKANNKEGRGTFRFANGDVYEGEWKANEHEGHGTYRYASGDVYEGERKAGVRDGRGTYWYATGRAEVSRWVAGEPVGEGAQWSADRQAASRLHDGKVHEAISLEDAQQIAAEIGLPAPEAADRGRRGGVRKRVSIVEPAPPARSPAAVRVSPLPRRVSEGRRSSDQPTLWVGGAERGWGTGLGVGDRVAFHLSREDEALSPKPRRWGL